MGMFPRNAAHEMRQAATEVIPSEDSFHAELGKYFVRGRTRGSNSPALSSGSNHAWRQYSVLQKSAQADNDKQ